VNTKSVLIIVLFAMILILLARANAQQSPPTLQQQVGRYQVVSLGHMESDKGRSVTARGVFKIDAQTDTSWMYISGIGDDGKVVEGSDRIADKVTGGAAPLRQ